MRILYLTQTFPPEPGPTKRPLEQAAHLRRLGHEVRIVTSMPFYPTGRVQPAYRRKVLFRETMQHVEVLRVWSLPAPNVGVHRRLLSFLSFAAGAFLCGIVQPRPDLVIASVPNIGTELAGLAVARLRRCPVLLELRDPIPDNLVRIGYRNHSLPMRWLEAYFTRIYREVDCIAVMNPGMIAGLVGRGVDRNRIIVVPHAGDPEGIDPERGRRKRRELQLMGKFVALYAGSFSSHYQVPNLVEAARILQERLPSGHLLLVGTGPDWERTRALVERYRLRNVTLLGGVAPEDVGDYLALADLFITSIHLANGQTGDLDGYPPTKLCEYLLVGRPVVAVEDARCAAPLLERIGAGRRVRALDPLRLADAIRDFAEHPAEATAFGTRGRRYALAHLTRARIVRELERELVERFARHRAGAAELTQAEVPKVHG